MAHESRKKIRIVSIVISFLYVCHINARREGTTHLIVPPVLRIYFGVCNKPTYLYNTLKPKKNKYLYSYSLCCHLPLLIVILSILLWFICVRSSYQNREMLDNRKNKNIQLQ